MKKPKWFHHEAQPVQQPPRVPPNPEEAQTPADHLDWMCQRFGATYEIYHRTDGLVIVVLKFPDHEAVSSGLAHNVQRAVAQLQAKMSTRMQT